MNKTTKDLFRDEPELVLKALKSKHADVNAWKQQWDGMEDLYTHYYQPIHVAEDPRVISALVSKGARVNEPNSAGFTPLLLAVASKKPLDSVRALVEAGADVNLSDENGNGPLHYAIDSPPIAQLLINAGANVFAKNADGKSPIDRAREMEGTALDVLQSAERHVDLGKQWDRHAPSPTPTPVSRGRDRW
jgi:hypothetical protein